MTHARRTVVSSLVAGMLLGSLLPTTGAHADAESGALARSSVEPAANGPWGHRRFAIDRGNIVDIGAPHRAEFTSEATLPTSTRGNSGKTNSGKTQTGRRPLLVFLHGAHPTCYSATDNDTIWPCAPGYEPIPSYWGYRYLADRMASQGFASVSISANGVNGQEDSFSDGGTTARAQLVDLHLRAIRRSAKGESDRYPRRFAQSVDLSQVMVIGHSRGAAGVAQAGAQAAQEQRSYRIRAAVSLAGTTQVKQAVPGLPIVAVLPQCDGDVIDLEGQLFVDVGARIPGDTALRSAIWVPGGNHNFLNTQWTPGRSVAFAWNDAAKLNDEPGPCHQNHRINSAQERRIAQSYVAATARLYLAGDQQMLQFLDGSAIRPGDVGRVATRSSATGGSALLLERRWNGRVQASGVRASTGLGLKSAEKVGWNDVQTPHWLPALRFPQRSTRQRAFEVSWQRRGTALHRLSRVTDLRGYDRLQARVAADSLAWRSGRVSLALRDSAGVTARVPVPHRQLTRFSPKIPMHLWGQSVSIPLRSFTAQQPKLDLREVRWIGLAPRSGSGRVWVLDAWARHAAPSTPRAGTAATVLAGGEAKWLGDGYRVTLRLTSARSAPHATGIDYHLSGYEHSGTLSRGHLTLPAGRRIVSRTFVVAARKPDNRLVVATYPDEWGLNLTDYVWLPVTNPPGTVGGGS